MVISSSIEVTISDLTFSSHDFYLSLRNIALRLSINLKLPLFNPFLYLCYNGNFLFYRSNHIRSDIQLPRFLPVPQKYCTAAEHKFETPAFQSLPVPLLQW